MKPEILFEENAEIRQTSGWCCKTCNRFFGKDERAARWCCATSLPCDCGRSRRGKTWSYCDICLKEKSDAKFLARPEKEHDGKAMLYSETEERYFTDLGDAEDFASDQCEYCSEEAPPQTPEEYLKSMRLIICEPVTYSHRWCGMEDILDDVLPEDYEPGSDSDFDEIDRIIIEWLKTKEPFSWQPGKFRLKLDKQEGAGE